MPEYAQEKDKFECTCLGERNKRVLKSALTFERDRLVQFEQALRSERESRKSMKPLTDFESDYKRRMLENSDMMIHSVSDDVIHIISLLDNVLSAETCGD